MSRLAVLPRHFTGSLHSCSREFDLAGMQFSLNEMLDMYRQDQDARYWLRNAAPYEPCPFNDVLVRVV